MNYRRLAVAATVALACSLAAAARAGEDEQQEFERAKAGLERARLTLAEAVEAALKRVPDGKAVEAEIETDATGAAFEVEVVSGTKHLDVKVDAVSGEILEVEEEVEEEEEARKGEKTPDDEQLENEAAASAKLSLLQAIAAAVKEAPSGKPFEASFHRHDGLLDVEVDLLDGKLIKEFHVDAMTGSILEVKQEAAEDVEEMDDFDDEFSDDLDD